MNILESIAKKRDSKELDTGAAGEVLELTEFT